MYLHISIDLNTLIILHLSILLHLLIFVLCLTNYDFTVKTFERKKYLHFIKQLITSELN